MKKYYTIIILILTAVILCRNFVYADENIDTYGGLYQHESDLVYPDAMYYAISEKDFESFVSDPSISLQYVTKYSYFVVPSDEPFLGYMKREIQSLYINDKYFVESSEPDENSIREWGKNLMSYGGLLSQTTFEYMKKDNIQNVLKQNGINEKVNTVAIVDVVSDTNSVFPAIIWINTKNKNNYYMVFQGTYGIYSDFDVSRLSFMTYAEFSDEFSLKTGKVYIDGKRAELNKPALFQGQYAIMPVRDIFEKLGSKVEWNTADKSIRIIYENKPYIFHSNLSAYMSDLNKKNILPYCNSLSFRDGTMYIGVSDFKNILSIFNVNINIKYEETCVIITS